MQRSWFACALIVTVLAYPIESWSQSFNHTIHVNPISAEALDSNPGTEALPLKTIGKAMERAIENKRAYQSTRVVLHPATFREALVSFGYTNWPTNDPGNHTPIVVEAKHPGTAVISGSDVWVGWTHDPTTGAWTHNWPYNWGRSPDPWDGVREAAEIVLRREMIFVDGIPLEQVLSVGEVNAGKFYVNESNDTVYLIPPVGISMTNTKIEVAVRERLWEQFYEDHVTLRSLVFEHAATPWSTSNAAIWIGGSDNFRLEDSEIRWTNWQGIYIGESDNVLIKNVTLNHHGGQGWGMFRNKNVVVEDSETSHNNWRGKLGNFHGWSIGNKLLSIHGLVIRNHKANDNHSRGLWLDYDISYVLVDGLEAKDNLLDGMWLEASQGPTTIKNSLFCNNGWNGLKTTYSRYVSVDNNLFAGNATRADVQLNDSQLVIDGGGERVIQDFETRNQFPLVVRDWSVTNNTFVGTHFLHPYAKGPTLIDNDLTESDWSTFLQTFKSDYNTWHHDARPEVFGFPKYNDLSLADWQTETGQDHNSHFSSDVPDLSCELVDRAESDQIDLYGEASGTAEVFGADVEVGTADTGVLRFNAFDVNGASELRVFVNDHEVNAGPGFIGNGKWMQDSLTFNSSLLVDGRNDIRFEVGPRPASGQTIGFKVDQIVLAATTTGVGSVDAVDPERGADFALTGNYPNPFSTSTLLQFSLPVSADVEVTVYDLLGREQMRLPRRSIAAGAERTFYLDASGLPAGHYMVRLVAYTPGEFMTATRPVSVVK